MSEPKYCSLLWKHISNEPFGHVRTCCIARERVTDSEGEEYTLGETSIREIFHSDYYKQIRQAIRDGERPTNCDACWRDEDNGVKSKRQIYNEYAEYRYPEIDYTEEPDMPEDLQIILSTTCNLKCRTCNPNYSSKWVKEAEARKMPYIKESVKVEMSDLDNSKFWTDLNDWLPHAKYLEVMGGEPFYMKEFKVFANKLIDDDIAKNVHVNLSTNGTTLNKDFLQKMIDNFASVGFNVSIDGIGKRFEYLRHGANWKDVSKNLDYFHSLTPGISIGITITVSSLNVHYLAEFHKMFAERWPNFIIFHNIANFPTWYNPNIFPEECKEDIVAPLLDLTQFRKQYQEDIKGIIKHVLTPRTETVVPYGNQPTDTVEAEIAWRWELFKTQTVAGDKYRKENFREVFNELFQILKYEFVYHLEEKKYAEDQNYGSLEKGSVI
jgi:MoaA/NifB/PqqE/SkfB family radical SAM enzyme